MGANFEIDNVALLEAENIPDVCRTYLSHHVRNGLQSIMAVALIHLGDNSEICDAIKHHVQHISNDMAKLGV